MTINAEQIAKQTQDQLSELLKVNAEKIKLETERIELEQSRIKKQQSLLEKEKEHISKLNDMVKYINNINEVINNKIGPMIIQMNEKMSEICKIQQTLVIFLLKEYEQINDKKYESTINMLQQTLMTMTHQKSDINVIGTVQSNNDVNIGD